MVMTRAMQLAYLERRCTTLRGRVAELEAERIELRKQVRKLEHAKAPAHAVVDVEAIADAVVRRLAEGLRR